MFFQKIVLAALLLLLISLFYLPSILGSEDRSITWSQQEIDLLASMSLNKLPDVPVEPSNAYSDDPQAARLGELIFHDPAFSRNGEVSCSSCHPEDKVFQDGLPQAEGMEVGPLRTMPLIAVAYNDWFFWDGRKDSLWSQALAPIEDPLEHGISRTKTFYLVNNKYQQGYNQVFGKLPEIPENYPEIARPDQDNEVVNRAWEQLDSEHQELINQTYANIGKSIGAYVRTIMPKQAPFDRFVQALEQGDLQKADSILSQEQQKGLKLFIGRGGCMDCHTGPLLSNGSFHDTGVNSMPESEYHPGRAHGIPQVQHDIFNCLGPYSDAGEQECQQLRFMDKDTKKYEQAFKTPTLRNVADRPPYFHAGQAESIQEVIDFYIQESESNPELSHVDLNQEDLESLVAFLQSLSGPVEVRRDLIGSLDAK